MIFTYIISGANAAAAKVKHVNIQEEEAEFYPNDHFNYSIKIQSQRQLDTLVGNIGSKTLFIRYIASTK